MIATKPIRCASPYDNKMSFDTKKGEEVYSTEYADIRTMKIPFSQENMNRDNRLGEITHDYLIATELEMITLITQLHLLRSG